MKFNNLVKSLMENFGEQYADGIYRENHPVSSPHVLEIEEVEFEFQAPVRGQLEDFHGTADVDYGMRYEPAQRGGRNDPSWDGYWEADEENVNYLTIYTTDESGKSSVVTPTMLGGVKEFLDLVKIAKEALNRQTEDQIENYDGDGSDEPDYDNDRDTKRDEPREWAGME